MGPQARRGRGQIVGEIKGLVGLDGARAVQAMLEGAAKPSSSRLATGLGMLTFFLGATGAFLELQTALNGIWRVKPKPSAGVRAMLLQRLVSFGLVIGVGFLLLVSLVVSAGLAAVESYLGNALPGFTVLSQALNVLVSLGVITLLFAMVYKVLPDVDLLWSDVSGSALTAVTLEAAQAAERGGAQRVVAVRRFGPFRRFAPPG